MAETPLLPKPTPVGLPSSNPLFRALDILTGGIAGAVTGDNVKRRVRDEQLQNAIEAQAREEAIRQQIMANRRNDAEGLGLDPMTATAAQITAAREARELTNRGNQRKQEYEFNREAKAREVGLDPMSATAEQINAAQEAKRLAFAKKSREQESEMDVLSKARQLGINPATKPAMGGPVNPFASPNITAAMQVGQPKPLEQQIAEAEMAKRVEMAGLESAARAKASDPYGDNFVQGDNMAINGKSIGRAVRDKRTGQYGIMGPDGKLMPIPEGAEPITATALQKAIPSYDSFRKATSDLTDSERSLRQIERYAKSMGGLQQGIAGLADKFTAGFKTLFDTGKLNPEEFARKIASGQLQGLLGGSRLAVVGGGVMTEQDAQRIIEYLGGDIGALQNKEQVMAALGQLYEDRRAQYEDNILFVNAATKDYYGERGYKERPYTDYSSLFRPPESPASPAPAPAAAPASFDEAKKKRLEELRAKAAAAGQR